MKVAVTASLACLVLGGMTLPLQAANHREAPIIKIQDKKAGRTGIVAPMFTPGKKTNKAGAVAPMFTPQKKGVVAPIDRNKGTRGAVAPMFTPQKKGVVAPIDRNKGTRGVVAPMFTPAR